MEPMMKYLLIFSFVFLTLLSGCYRMPDDDYCSTIPLTNNPQVVPQRGGPKIPGANF